MEFKIGDELRCIKEGDGFKVGDIVNMVKERNPYNDKPTMEVSNGNKKNIWVYQFLFELAEYSNSISENTMEQKVYKVLIVNKKTKKVTKDETVVAVNEQSALLQAFGQNAEDSFISIEEKGKFNVKDTPTVILKEESKKGK